MLPQHGKMNCTACFDGVDKKSMKPHPGWKMVNDPGAWGGAEPEFLVLGFSKGSTQANIYDKGRFEDIAFAGMRPRLTAALQAMGALKVGESADEKIADPNSNMAFGSLIRCSVSRINEKKSKTEGRDIFECSGALITKSFTEIPQIINECSNKYLTNLPSSVRAVFLLGNSAQYVESCQSLLKTLFPDSFSRINPMAVMADNRLWTHLAHPSGSNGHFSTWLEGNTGQGQKRIEALDAVKANAVREIDHA